VAVSAAPWTNETGEWIFSNEGHAWQSSRRVESESMRDEMEHPGWSEQGATRPNAHVTQMYSFRPSICTDGDDHLQPEWVVEHEMKTGEDQCSHTTAHPSTGRPIPLHIADAYRCRADADEIAHRCLQAGIDSIFDLDSVGLRA
jgi:hypothetical protein